MTFKQRTLLKEFQFLGFICFCSFSNLSAQERTEFTLSKDNDNVAYQFQLRVLGAGNEMKSVVGKRSGGGTGFLVMFGDTPLRPRLRLDFDSFPAKSNVGLFQSAGFAIEGVFSFPTFGHCSPFISCGPAIQRWSIDGIDQYSRSKRRFTKLAGRLEAGIRIGNHGAFSIGYLAGNLDSQQHASIAYIAITVQPGCLTNRSTRRYL